jgi:hypothetical protein
VADETKTEEQLIAEQSTSGTDEPAAAQDATPVVLTPSTRRGVLRWIAPVAVFVRATLKASTAEAASTDDFVPPGRCTPTP